MLGRRNPPRNRYSYLNRAVVEVCRERDTYRDVAENACAELHGIGLAIGRTEKPTHVTTEEVAMIAAERDRLAALVAELEAELDDAGNRVYWAERDAREAVRAYQSHASPGERPSVPASPPSPAAGAIEPEPASPLPSHLDAGPELPSCSEHGEQCEAWFPEDQVLVEHGDEDENYMFRFLACDYDAVIYRVNHYQRVVAERDAAVKRAGDAEARSKQHAKQALENGRECCRQRTRTEAAEARVAELEAELARVDSALSDYGIEWAMSREETVNELARRLCATAIDKGRAEAELAQARGAVPECVERFRGIPKNALGKLLHSVRNKTTGIWKWRNLAADCLEWLATQPQPAAEPACNHPRTETVADCEECQDCGERRMNVWGDQSKPAACRVEPFSSRTCERGTNSCEVWHGDAAEPAAVDELVEAAQSVERHFAARASVVLREDFNQWEEAMAYRILRLRKALAAMAEEGGDDG